MVSSVSCIKRRMLSCRMMIWWSTTAFLAKSGISLGDELKVLSQSWTWFPDQGDPAARIRWHMTRAGGFQTAGRRNLSKVVRWSKAWVNPSGDIWRGGSSMRTSRVRRSDGVPCECRARGSCCRSLSRQRPLARTDIL